MRMTALMHAVQRLCGAKGGDKTWLALAGEPMGKLCASTMFNRWERVCLKQLQQDATRFGTENTRHEVYLG